MHDRVLAYDVCVIKDTHDVRKKLEQPVILIALHLHSVRAHALSHLLGRQARTAATSSTAGATNLRAAQLAQPTNCPAARLHANVALAGRIVVA